MPAGHAGGLNFIRLATPTTDDKRLPEVLNNTSGFVCMSITGITGAAAPQQGAVAANVARIKKHTDLPVCIGFGIRTAELPRMADIGDGVVVGSALVDVIATNLDGAGNTMPICADEGLWPAPHRWPRV